VASGRLLLEGEDGAHEGKPVWTHCGIQWRLVRRSRDGKVGYSQSPESCSTNASVLLRCAIGGRQGKPA
jgi:hypothetical protein